MTVVRVNSNEVAAGFAAVTGNPYPLSNGVRSTDRNMYWGGGGVSPSKPDVKVNDTRDNDQSAKPSNPGLRYATQSTYGKVIPISFGRRRLEGNLIQSSAMVPRMVGTKTVYTTEEVPIYDDPPTRQVIPTITAPDCPPEATGFQPICELHWNRDDSTDCPQSDSCNTRDGATHSIDLPKPAVGWYYNRSTAKSASPPESDVSLSGWTGPFPSSAAAYAAMPDCLPCPYWTCVGEYDGTNINGFCD